MKGFFVPLKNYGAVIVPLGNYDAAIIMEEKY